MSSSKYGQSSLRTQLIIVTRTEEDDPMEWYVAVSFVARVAVFIAIVALLMYIVSLILKYIGISNDVPIVVEQVTATETNRLLSKTVIPFAYGACEDDPESGKCSSSSSNDLYDGKICIICYDEERNCFFVPCGHCATCYICAQRIIDEEIKTCPVCRRFIRKVRKMFASVN